MLLATNQITPGAVMSFLVATQTIQRSLGNLSVLFGQVVRGMTAGSRIFEVSGSHCSPGDRKIKGITQWLYLVYHGQYEYFSQSDVT